MNELVELVEQWSKDKGLDKAESSKQFAYIDGFPNHIVTNIGKVFVMSYVDLNGRRRKSHEAKQRLNVDGYPSVLLTNSGKRMTTRVHRLVAEAFIPNPENKETVNHIDGNKENNNVSNLEWADRSEQMYHAYELGLKKPTAVSKLSTKISNGKPIKCFKKETGETSYYLSARDCSKELGYSERWCDKIISDMSGETRMFRLQYVSLDEVKQNTDKVSISTLVDLVSLWSMDKGLHKADPTKQFLKVTEEFSEIAAALSRGNEELFKDAVGDTIVTLIIIAQQKGYTLEDCVNAAYNEIKDRRGKLVDGTFIKEASE